MITTIVNVLFYVAVLVNAWALVMMMTNSILDRIQKAADRKDRENHGIIEVHTERGSDKSAAAIHRYSLMAGWDDTYDRNALDNAEKDRTLYGDKYLAFRNGEPFANPIRILRFMVDICQMDFRDADICARRILAIRQPYVIGEKATDETIAAVLLAESEDIHEAIAVASFLHEGFPSDAQESTFWFGVNYVLRRGNMRKATEQKWVA